DRPAGPAGDCPASPGVDGSAGVLVTRAGYRRRVTQGQAATERARALADPAAFDEIADPAVRKVLRAYLVRGRLPVIPRGGTKRSLLLAYLATAFEPGVRYPETEVNAIVGVWHPDVAALR